MFDKNDRWVSPELARWAAAAPHRVGAAEASEDAHVTDAAFAALARSSAPMGFWSWDLTTDVFWRSAELYRLHGVGPGGLGERLEDYLDFVHPDDRQRVSDASWSATTGNTLPIEYRFVHPEGGVRHLMGHSALVRDPLGEAVRLVGTVQDVTDVMRARRAVASTFEQLFAHFEDLPTPAYLWKKEGGALVLRRLNRAATVKWGRHAERLLGQSATELNASRPDIIADLKRCLETQTAFSRDSDFVSHHLGTRRSIVTYVPLGTHGVVVHALDITEIVSANRRERRATEQLAEYFERVPTPAHLWRGRGGEIVLEKSNAAGVEQTRGSSAKYVGITARELYADRPDIREDLQRGVGGETFTREYPYRMRDTGEERELVVTYVHLPPDTCVAHTRDVTAQRGVETELLRSRERHERAQRIGHLGHWEWNLDADELLWSDEACRILGVEPCSEISFERFMECVHPADRDLVGSEVERALSRGGPYAFEHRVVLPDGSVRMIREQGEVARAGELPRSMIGVVLDITDLKQAEQVIREREAEMTTVMEGNPDGICLIVGGHIAACNGSLAALVGCPREELLGRKLHDLMVPEDRERAVERGRAILEGGRSAPSEYTFKRCDGSPVPVEIYAAAFDFRGEQGLICTLRDVGARKEAEHELARSRDALRALTQHLEQVRELERVQVARDLHDELGSVLTALKIDIRELAALGSSSEKSALIEGMSALVDQAIEVGRRVTARLRPGILDDLGLAAATEWLGTDLEKRTGVRCRVVLPEREPHLSEPVATAMFRILQEAVTNVVRHAHASCVEIALEADDRCVSLAVTDNGTGFDPAAPSGPGFGLLGMRERVRAFDGVFDLSSAPGEGTVIRVALPLERPAN